MDELMNPVDSACARIRALMLEEAERDLGEIEAKRVERHVGSCSSCQALLAGDDLELPEIPLPEPSQWLPVDATIAAATGRASSPGPQLQRTEPGQRWWKSAWLPAAAVFLIGIVLLSALREPDVPEVDLDGTELTAVEILEAPDGTFPIVETFEDDADGVVVFFMSG